MMKFCFILASISGREHLLREFIASAKISKYKDCDFYLYFQKTGAEEPDFDRSFFRDIIWSSSRDGVCLPRMRLLEKYPDYDFWIIVDDDVEFLGLENFEPMMKFLQVTPDAGIVVGTHKNNKKYYEKAVQQKRMEVKNISFIEGGAVISRKIRDLLLREIPMERIAYDGYSIITYVHGYTNYKYFGSVVLHKATNGNLGWVYVKRHESEFDGFFDKYICMRPDHMAKAGELSLPDDELDLTPKARELHRRNKEAIANGENS